MSVNRYYSSTAASTTLVGGIGSGATSMVVASVSGFPVSYPYTLIIDRTGTKEAIKVTGAAGTTLTVVRGQDGTSAVAHNNGDAVEHGATAQDFREPQEHIAASTDVHGLSGGASVVGTSSSQTLTNKTLTTPTVGSLANMNHTHAASGATGGTIAHSALTGLTTGDPHTQYQQESEKAAASGYASLDSGTKVPLAQLPTGNTSSLVSLGNQSGYMVADNAIDTPPTTVNASEKSLCSTTDIATEAGITYMVMGHLELISPSDGNNFSMVLKIQESYDSGANWVEVSSTPVIADSGIADASSLLVKSNSTIQGCGTQHIVFATPGAKATCRWRWRAVRLIGSNTADITQANLHVVRIGTKLF